MDHSSNYERVLPLRKKGAHLRFCIFVYLSYLAVFVLGTVWFLNTFSPYVAALTLLGTLSLVLLTHKRLQAEYEYEFFGGTLTVARILGKSSRVVLAELETRNLLLADYLSPASESAAQRLKPEKTVDARSDPDAAPALILVFEREDKSRGACILETDEQTERILRRAAPDACSYELKRGAPKQP